MKLSKKELIKTKQSIAYKIRNIKEDYSELSNEDIPGDVVAELAILFTELHAIRQQLEEQAS